MARPKKQTTQPTQRSCEREREAYAMLAAMYDLKNPIAKALARHIALNAQIIADCDQAFKEKPLIEAGHGQPYTNPALKTRKETLDLDAKLYERLEAFARDVDEEPIKLVRKKAEEGHKLLP